MASAQQKLELPEDDEQRLSICSDSAAAAAAAAAGGVDLKTNNNNNNDDDDDGSSLNINKPAARLPRWTRQEILVLIQGKKVAENRVRRGRSLAATAEPKWATVSSYCKRHGVNRGAVQCRKRWSNLAADFKKIKDWELSLSLSSRDNADADSFWVMRNDLRRDRKLPGFFDREVYDILDNKHHSPPPPPPSPVLFDSGRTAPPHDPLFSDLTAAGGGGGGGGDEKQAAAANPEIGSPSSSRKRKRLLVEDDDVEEEGGSLSLLQIMEKNGRILSAQLEAHNVNLKLDREDRKDHSNSLVAVLNKLADALSRIADKL